MNATERANIFVEAAVMARENARTRRTMARTWTADHREWIEHDLTEAHKAFRRAYDYLHSARQLRNCA